MDSEGVLEQEFLSQAESDDFDTWTAAGLTLIAWFADCWQVAGGRDFPLLASIRLHDADIYDGGRYFNLVRGDWEQGIVC